MSLCIRYCTPRQRVALLAFAAVSCVCVLTDCLVPNMSMVEKHLISKHWSVFNVGALLSNVAATLVTSRLVNLLIFLIDIIVVVVVCWAVNLLITLFSLAVCTLYRVWMTFRGAECTGVIGLPTITLSMFSLRVWQLCEFGKFCQKMWKLQSLILILKF